MWNTTVGLTQVAPISTSLPAHQRTSVSAYQRNSVSAHQRCNLPLASCLWHPLAFTFLYFALPGWIRAASCCGGVAHCISSADFMPSCLHAFMPSGLPLHFTIAVCVGQLYLYTSCRLKSWLHDMPWNLWDWYPACRCGQNYRGSKPGTKSSPNWPWWNHTEIVLLVWSQCGETVGVKCCNATCPVWNANAVKQESIHMRPTCTRRSKPHETANPKSGKKRARNFSLGCHWGIYHKVCLFLILLFRSIMF